MTTDNQNIDIAAYWQFRMTQAAHFDPTVPDQSLAQFMALPPVVITPVELIAHANTVLAAYLTNAIEFNVGTSSQQVIVLCDGTNSTRADLALLALYGQGNASGTKLWIDNNGKTTTLTGSQLVALATLVGTWIADCYGALSTIIGNITQSSPSITTFAQIDSYNWPTS